MPVLVVGGGPAGLVTAVTLAREGIRCMLVERRRRLSSHPKATSVSTRTMELLRSWGLEEEVRSGGVDVDWVMWEVRDARPLRRGRRDPRRPAVAGPERADQPHVAGLRAPGSPRACAARPPALARVRAGRAGDGARGDRRRRRWSSGAPEGADRKPVGRCEARFVVAADGARSKVRGELGHPHAWARSRAHRRQRALSRPPCGTFFRPPLRDLLRAQGGGGGDLPALRARRTDGATAS